MIPLRPALNDYLTMRRALGYTLKRTEKLLADFVGFVEVAATDRITIDLALSWATLPVDGDVSWSSARLTVVRGFAKYLHTLDPAIEVPPTDLLPARSHRAAPYLYSDDDIAALMVAAETLRFPLRVLTYQTLIPLLAVTGMRVGEAIPLDRNDLDLGHGLHPVWKPLILPTTACPIVSTVSRRRSTAADGRRPWVFPQPVQRCRGTHTHDSSSRCRHHRQYPPHLIRRRPHPMQTGPDTAT